MVEELMRDFAVGAGGARPPLGRLFLWLCRHADSRRPAPRPLRSAPADDRQPRSPVRRLCAVCNRRLARHGHCRPVPDRRLGGLQPGGRDGHCRAMVRGQSLCDLLGARHGHGHGRRRVRSGAPAGGHRSLRLAHRDAVPGGGRRHPVSGRLGHGPRQVARQRRHGRCAVGSAQGLAPSPDPADRADRMGTSSPLLAFAGLWGVPFLETAYGMSRRMLPG